MNLKHLNIVGPYSLISFLKTVKAPMSLYFCLYLAKTQVFLLPPSDSQSSSVEQSAALQRRDLGELLALLNTFLSFNI